MRTRHEARARLARYTADLTRLLERAERNVGDVRLGAAITALVERMTHDLVALYARREHGVDEILHGIVEPALEQARNALRTARARPAAITRTLRSAADALSRVA